MKLSVNGKVCEGERKTIVSGMALEERGGAGWGEGLWFWSRPFIKRN